MLTVIWRALTDTLNGGWTEVISRADGLIFFTVVVGTVWAAVRRFSDKRWLAAAAAFIVCAVPLQVWHSVAGYSDIALEAFLVVAFAAVLRGEWLVGGVMAAGAAWCKNDALVLYIPALLLGVLLVHAQHWNWRKVGSFLAGLATVTPWLAFNFAHSLGITPARPQVSWHSDSLKLLWNAVFTSATSGILWVCILLCAVYLCRVMFNDTLGRALILSFSLSVLAIAFIFTSTSAYAFLADETTIHRTLLQFSATAIVIITYGLSLRLGQARESQRGIQTKKRRSIPAI